LQAQKGRRLRFPDGRQWQLEPRTHGDLHWNFRYFVILGF